MTTLISTALIAVIPAAGEVLDTYSWTDLIKTGSLDTTAIVADGSHQNALIIEGTPGSVASIQLTAIAQPPVTKPIYGLIGEIKYENVGGQGFLEMWSVISDTQRFFSRSLGPSGPLQRLEGSSNWRYFALPAVTEPDKLPRELVLNVILPDGGKVWLSPLKLMQYDSRAEATMIPGQWWSESTAGLVGGLGGALFGCLGGVIGWLGSKGKARSFVMGLITLFIICGVAGLITGGVSIAMQQPYAVYYPLLLGGGLLTIIPLAILRSICVQYQQFELRKMQAADA